jgi:8-oxo-dGTP pyrophosphatase MutT (NUDIX family)
MIRSGVLSEEEFGRIVRCAPLVSIDIIIRDPERKVLLGLRNHEPAKGYYFVPGGRIRKGELLKEAFSRILAAETACRIVRCRPNRPALARRMLFERRTSICQPSGA